MSIKDSASPAVGWHTRPRLLRAAPAFAAAVAACGISHGTADAAAVCHAGVHSFGSGQERTFCGPATATVHVGGHVVTLQGGNCERTSQSLVVNIGSAPLGHTGQPVPNYFGLDLGRINGSGSPASRDGTYQAFVLSIAVAGKSYILAAPKVTLTGGRTRGTFAGAVLTGGTVSGSFACGG